MKRRRFQTKAQFFTITAVLIISIYIVSFNHIAFEKYSTKAKLVQTKADSVNWFIMDVQSDLDNVIYISGTRAMIALLEDISDSHNYISDLDGDFKELLINGTLDGTPNTFMENSTIINWSDNVKNIAKDNYALEFDIKDYNTRVYQEDPWFITVELTALLNITDTEKIFYWNTTLNNTIQISILHLEDPLYTIESNANIIRNIQKTSISEFIDYSAAPPDVDNLMDFIHDKEYIHSNSSPNFLMRMQGDFSFSECCGIESIVDVQEIIPYPQYLFERSHIDYIYWSDPTNPQTPGDDFWYIEHTHADSNFLVRLDNQSEHHIEYNVTAIAHETLP